MSGASPAPETSAEPGPTGSPQVAPGFYQPTLKQRVKAWFGSIDIWSWRRKPITEESGIHKTWPEEAHKVRTVWDFIRFHDKLMNGYHHDYGTICHAIAAISVAAACLSNRDKVNGGITGFQAGAIMWEWLHGWGTGPKNIGRMLDYEDMLYPQYASKFIQISRRNWAFLQKKAAENLVESPTANPAVIRHWQSIVDGTVPFGLFLEPAPGEE